MNPSIQFKKTTILPLLIASMFGCLGLLPRTQGAPLLRSSCNTAEGFQALENITTGVANTAFGCQALFSEMTGSRNTATGSQALFSNIAGINNTAIGNLALQNNINGSNNTAIGNRALNASTGSNNTALGSRAGVNIVAGNDNVFFGINAGINYPIGGSGTVTDIIAIGEDGDSNSNNGGRCYIGNIRGVQVGNPDGVPVFIDSDGQLGTIISSRRFKKDIKAMDQVSEAILALKPVTFHYKDVDTKKAEDTPQYGLIAEDVADVNPDLVAYDNDGQPLSVRYEAVNVLLLNEFLKEHRTVQEQKTTITQLKKDFAQQQKQIEALTAGLQKVSAQVEASKPAPQVVNNP